MFFAAGPLALLILALVLIEVISIILYKRVLFTNWHAQVLQSFLELLMCFEVLSIVLNLKVLDDIFECILLSLYRFFVVPFVNIEHVFFQTFALILQFTFLQVSLFVTQIHQEVLSLLDLHILICNLTLVQFTWIS